MAPTRHSGSPWGVRRRQKPLRVVFAAVLVAMFSNGVVAVADDGDGAAGSTAAVAFGPPTVRYPEELVLLAEGNRLRRVDPDTIDATDPAALRHDVFVENAAGGGRDVNGMVCTLPDGSGRFIVSEDSGQPHPPAGWGVFDSTGHQVGKLATTAFTAGPEPFGCAFDSTGRLFTSEVGTQGFGPANGQLMLWFPPLDRYPGTPGAYPATDALSTNVCKLATDIGTAGAVAIDDLGRVYVAASSGLSIERFSPPFPTGTDAAHGCGALDASGAPMATSVQRDTFAVAGDGGMLTFSGLAWAPNGHLYASSVFTGRIAEYDESGGFVRLLLDPPEAIPPIATGTPQGIAVGSDGTIYYADLDLVGTLPDIGPGPNGALRRIRFDAAGDPLPPEIVLEGLAFPDGVTIVAGDLETDEWATFAGSYERRFAAPADPYVAAATAGGNFDLADPNGTLRTKWEFPTGAIVTASPTVADIDVGGGSTRRVVYVPSWDHHVYALDFDDGSVVWDVAVEEQPGATFPAAASVDVSTIGGVPTAIVGVGEILYAFDARDGSERWRFTAGTGCRDANGDPPGSCGFGSERNEIESSVAVADGLVFFGLDVNDVEQGKGGFYAVAADTGRLVWFRDLQSATVCRPAPGDDIRRFDGYHSEAELGLPPGFFASRPGCDFPRDRTGCENVWSSAAYDDARALLYFSTSNCDTDANPATTRPAPPMPPEDEALVALHLDGTLAWRWRPREVDNDDLAFGAAPNLFTLERTGGPIDALGIPNKDGTYTVLDRDGVNEETGTAWTDPGAATELPYWRTALVPGGPIGGFPQTASVDETRRRVYLSNAPGFDPLDPQRPTVHALDLDTGAVVWQHDDPDPITGDASFGPTSSASGLVFVGSVLTAQLRIFDGGTGTLLGSWSGAPGSFGLASGPTIVDGTVLFGHGLGARSPDPGDPSDLTSRLPAKVVALCFVGAPGCPDHDVTSRWTAEELAYLDIVAARLGTDRAGAQAAGAMLFGWIDGLLRANGSAPYPQGSPNPTSGPTEVTSHYTDGAWAAVASASSWFGLAPDRLQHDGALALAWILALVGDS